MNKKNQKDRELASIDCILFNLLINEIVNLNVND